MNPLPAELNAFFEQTSRRGAEALLRPSWLLCDVSQESWKVATSSSARTVEGKHRGVETLHWNRTIPGGTLADEEFQTLMQQAKQILIAAFSGTRAGLKTTQIQGFHFHLIGVIEFLVLADREGARTQGLAALDLDLATEYLVRLRRGGREETSFFGHRWDECLDAALTSEHAAFLESWLSTQPARVRAAIEDTNRAIKSHDSADAPQYERTMNDAQLRLMRAHLYQSGAFGSDGRVTSQYISAAIQIDSRRVKAAQRLALHLRQFELCIDYRRTSFAYHSRLGELPHEPMTRSGSKDEPMATSTVYNWLGRLAEAAWAIPQYRNWPIADVASVKGKLAAFSFSPAGRTKSMPLSTARKLIGHCVNWINEVGPELIPYFRTVVGQAHLRHGAGSFGRVGPLEMAFSEVAVPEALAPLRLRAFWGHKVAEVNAELRREDGSSSAVLAMRETGLSVSDAMELHCAICFVVVALMSCSRLSEVLSIEDEDLTCKDGRWFLHVNLGKTGVRAAARKLAKPVPPLVAQALLSLQSLRDALLPFQRSSDPVAEKRTFYRMRRIPDGGHELRATEVYPLLELLSEYLDLRAPSGPRWRIRPHELRRLFALTFFHHGGSENSLPALSWFMGHNEIAMTWRYIKEELSGSEITSIEAALAIQAVTDPVRSEAAGRLVSLLRRTFGVESIETLTEDELLSYLEVLKAEGAFSASPVQIATQQGIRYDVLIHISGGVSLGATK